MYGYTLSETTPGTVVETPTCISQRDLTKKIVWTAIIAAVTITVADTAIEHIVARVNPRWYRERTNRILRRVGRK